MEENNKDVRIRPYCNKPFIDNVYKKLQYYFIAKDYLIPLLKESKQKLKNILGSIQYFAFHKILQSSPVG